MTAPAQTAASEPLAVEASGSTSGAAPTSPPDATGSPSGGEHHDELVWESEFADRWAALQPLLTSTVGEDWRECVHGAPGPCDRCGGEA